MRHQYGPRCESALRRSRAEATTDTDICSSRQERHSDMSSDFLVLACRPVPARQALPRDAGQPRGCCRQKTQAKRGEGVELRRENRFLKCSEEEAGSAREGKILVGLERPLELTAPAHHYVSFTQRADTPSKAPRLSDSRHRDTIRSIPLLAYHRLRAHITARHHCCTTQHSRPFTHFQSSRLSSL